MGNRPIQKWRIGNMDLSVWENVKKLSDNVEVNFRTFSLTRSYKKKDEDIWRSEVINNLRRNDIPKLQTLLRQVQDYLYLHTEQKEKDEEEE